MKHLFILYELAVIAKQKGFNESCFGYYGHNGKLYIDGQQNYNQAYNIKELVLAPLYQQIIDWFKEKHLINIIPCSQSSLDLTYTVFSLNRDGRKLEFISDNRDKAIEESFKLI